jgi:hypothetical protein
MGIAAACTDVAVQNRQGVKLGAFEKMLRLSEVVLPDKEIEQPKNNKEKIFFRKALFNIAIIYT